MSGEHGEGHRQRAATGCATAGRSPERSWRHGGLVRAKRRSDYRDLARRRSTSASAGWSRELAQEGAAHISTCSTRMSDASRLASPAQVRRHASPPRPPITSFRLHPPAGSATTG